MLDFSTNAPLNAEAPWRQAISAITFIDSCILKCISRLYSLVDSEGCWSNNDVGRWYVCNVVAVVRFQLKMMMLSGMTPFSMMIQIFPSHLPFTSDIRTWQMGLTPIACRCQRFGGHPETRSFPRYDVRRSDADRLRPRVPPGRRPLCGASLFEARSERVWSFLARLHWQWFVLCQSIFLHCFWFSNKDQW